MPDTIVEGGISSGENDVTQYETGSPTLTVVKAVLQIGAIKIASGNDFKPYLINYGFDGNKYITGPDYGYPNAYNSLASIPYELEFTEDQINSFTDETLKDAVSAASKAYRVLLIDAMEQWLLNGILWTDAAYQSSWIRTTGVESLNRQRYTVEKVALWKQSALNFLSTPRASISLSALKLKAAYNDAISGTFLSKITHAYAIPLGVDDSGNTQTSPMLANVANGTESMQVPGFSSDNIQEFGLVVFKRTSTTSTPVPDLGSFDSDLGDWNVILSIDTVTVLAITNNCKSPDGKIIPGVYELLNSSDISVRDIIIEEDPVLASLIEVKIFDIVTGEETLRDSLYVKGVS